MKLDKCLFCNNKLRQNTWKEYWCDTCGSNEDGVWYVILSGDSIATHAYELIIEFRYGDEFKCYSVGYYYEEDKPFIMTIYDSDGIYIYRMTTDKLILTPTNWKTKLPTILNIG